MAHMSTREELAKQVEDFLAKHGMAPTTFGVLTTGDRKLVAQLRKGRDVRTETADILREFMRDYRPAQKKAKTMGTESVAA